MVLWDSSPPSSAGFLNKVTIPCPNTSSLDLFVYLVASSVRSKKVELTEPESRMMVAGVGAGVNGEILVKQYNASYLLVWLPCNKACFSL